jgi:hypothetical protein
MAFSDYKRGLKILRILTEGLPTILLLTVCLQGCQRSHPGSNALDYRLNVDTEILKRSPEVVLIIPDGFSGPLRIVKDPSHGQQLPLNTNRLVIEFPENGTVTVKNFAVLEKPHVWSLKRCQSMTMSYLFIQHYSAEKEYIIID